MGRNISQALLGIVRGLHSHRPGTEAGSDKMCKQNITSEGKNLQTSPAPYLRVGNGQHGIKNCGMYS